MYARKLILLIALVELVLSGALMGEANDFENWEYHYDFDPSGIDNFIYVKTCRAVYNFDQCWRCCYNELGKNGEMDGTECICRDVSQNAASASAHGDGGGASHWGYGDQGYSQTMVQDPYSYSGASHWGYGDQGYEGTLVSDKFGASYTGAYDHQGGDMAIVPVTQYSEHSRASEPTYESKPENLALAVVHDYAGSSKASGSTGGDEDKQIVPVESYAGSTNKKGTKRKQNKKNQPTKKSS